MNDGTPKPQKRPRISRHRLSRWAQDAITFWESARPDLFRALKEQGDLEAHAERTAAAARDYCATLTQQGLPPEQAEEFARHEVLFAAPANARGNSNITLRERLLTDSVTDDIYQETAINLSLFIK